MLMHLIAAATILYKLLENPKNKKQKTKNKKVGNNNIISKKKKVCYINLEENKGGSEPRNPPLLFG